MTKRKPVLIQGRGPRRPTPPIIFKTKLVPEGPTKIFLETGPPLIYPPPPPTPPLSQGMDPALETNSNKQAGSEITQYNIDSIGPSL